MKRKLKFILPAVYLAFCLSAWIDFYIAPPDGLANFPLLIMTLPMILIVNFIPLHYITDGFHSLGLPSGYIIDHVYWFVPMITLQALCLYWIGLKISLHKPKRNESADH